MSLFEQGTQAPLSAFFFDVTEVPTAGGRRIVYRWIDSEGRRSSVTEDPMSGVWSQGFDDGGDRVWADGILLETDPDGVKKITTPDGIEKTMFLDGSYSIVDSTRDATSHTTADGHMTVIGYSAGLGGTAVVQGFRGDDGQMHHLSTQPLDDPEQLL